MISGIASALRRTAELAVARPRASAWTIVALTCALFALGLGVLAADHVDRWTAGSRGAASMVVYLGETVDAAHAQQLVAELGRLPGVERAELVPPAETARRLELALGATGARSPLLEGVELASLPASVEVTLASGVRDVVAMSPTVRALRGAPGVDDVVIAEDGADRVSGTLSAVRVLAWSGAAVLAGLAVLLVLAQLRVRLERDRHEQAVMRLLGASPAFTTLPAALAGALHGLVAAVLAAAALCVGIAAYGDAIASALAGALGSIDLAVPALPELAVFVVLGAVLGFLGGGLAGAAR